MTISLNCFRITPKPWHICSKPIEDRPTSEDLTLDIVLRNPDLDLPHIPFYRPTPPTMDPSDTPKTTRRDDFPTFTRITSTTPPHRAATLPSSITGLHTRPPRMVPMRTMSSHQPWDSTILLPGDANELCRRTTQLETTIQIMEEQLSHLRQLHIHLMQITFAHQTLHPDKRRSADGISNYDIPRPTTSNTRLKLWDSVTPANISLSSVMNSPTSDI
jgi:hypothetical protein